MRKFIHIRIVTKNNVAKYSNFEVVKKNDNLSFYFYLFFFFHQGSNHQNFRRKKTLVDRTKYFLDVRVGDDRTKIRVGIKVTNY